MDKKNFYGEIKNLHKQIVAEILALMVEHKKAVVDLAGSQAPHAFIIGVPDFDADMDYIEAEVMKVILEDGKVKFDINWDIDSEDYLDKYPNENGDIGDLYQVIDATDFEKLIPCAGIDSVYEAVFQVLEYDWDDNDEEEHPLNTIISEELNAIFGRDKSVFLLDKQYYRSVQVENLTEKDLEEWVAEEDYDDNDTIIKIDANDYDTPEAAIEGEFSFIDPEDYYIFSFGFDIP